MRLRKRGGPPTTLTNPNNTEQYLSEAVKAVETTKKELETLSAHGTGDVVQKELDNLQKINSLNEYMEKSSSKEDPPREGEMWLRSAKNLEMEQKEPERWENMFRDNFDLFMAAPARPISHDVFLPAHFTTTKYSGAVMVSKALLERLEKAIPPNFQTYATLSYQPEQYYSGTLVWPGIPPNSLTKIVQDNLAPQMVIGVRVDDIMAYSQISDQPWKPGWRISPRYADAEYSDSLSSRMRDAEFLLKNGTVRALTSSQRRMNRLMNFENFLSAIVRDSLTYDAISIWTSRKKDGGVVDFSPIPSANIRLVSPDTGYLGDKSIFAVGVDELGNVVYTFTPDQMYWYVRNPRLNVEVHGYGYSEIEIAIKLIQGFTNVLGMNLDRFNTSSIPNGILMIKGAYNQRVLDVLQRQLLNFKKGPSRTWTIPVLATSEDADIKMLDLSDFSGMETLYPDFINMLMGALSTVYRMPPSRLGYRPSGKYEEVKQPKQDDRTPLGNEVDQGRVSLLMAIEHVINDAIIWPTFPELSFSFLGKNPKEEARQYEERVNTMTYGERRKVVGLPPLKTLIPGDAKEKEVMEEVVTLMELSPGDPSQTGVYQSILSGQGLAGNKGLSGGGGKEPGAAFPKRSDPASSEDHGHVSGVRQPARPSQDK